MANLLVVNSSLSGANGNSNKLTQSFVEAWQAKQQGTVTQRDVNETNLPHLAGAEMGAWMTPADQRTEEQQALAAVSDELIAEVKEADAIVIGVPMYNFGIPSTFKAWIDRIARAGITFKYTETGPVGLLENKKVYVLAARGGMYAGTAKDSQTVYLKDVLAFLGLTDVEFVYAEGLAMGPEAAEKAFSAANEKIIELIG